MYNALLHAMHKNMQYNTIINNHTTLPLHGTMQYNMIMIITMLQYKWYNIPINAIQYSTNTTDTANINDNNDNAYGGNNTINCTIIQCNVAIAQINGNTTQHNIT